MSRGLLVTLAGYPYTLTSLMPDNGLANLAGALINEGHEVRIIDYGTLSTIERLVPKKQSDELRKTYRRLMPLFSEDGLSKKAKMIAIGLKLKRLDSLLEKARKKNDIAIARELAASIKDYKPDYIGFKLWLGDGLDSSLTVASILREEFPGLKIYGGGPLVDLIKETFYRKTEVFDALAFGEGEESITGLADYSIGKSSLRKIPNIVYLDGNKPRTTATERINDLNSLPYPVYDSDIYPSMTSGEKLRILTMDESRGCPYHCAFCPHIEKSGNLWRKKDAGRVVSEIQRFIDKYKINAFRYGGSNPPSDLVVDVAKLIIEKGLKVYYSSFAYAGNMNYEELTTLRKSGLLAFSFGVESGDDRILKESMLKQTTAAETRKALESTINAGIYTVGSMIYPAPGETPESRKNTLDLLKDVFANNDQGSVQVYFPGVYPNTIWGKEPERFGFTMDDDPQTYGLKYMNYKIKRLFPPSLWEPLPYKVDNKPYKQFSKETENFVKDLEKNGITTMIADEMAVISHLYDPQLSVKEFRDEVRELVFSGDHEKIGDIVQRINGNIENNCS